ncbi:MAG: lipoprotein insertase outer membrane protein LolB [Halothiobacillus sp.]
MSSLRIRPAALGLVFLGLLAGCAQLPTKPELTAAQQQRLMPEWQRHELAVRQQENWQCIGRIAIRTETQGGTVNLDWQQTGLFAKITLSAPLNQGVVELRGQPGLMMITDSSGNKELTRDPEATIAKLTGWQIPINALPDWIRGIPHDSNASFQLNAQGLLHTLQDAGWQIEYEQYTPPTAANRPMPQKITVSKDDVRLRLIVESWQFPPLNPEH